jgi:hypothetical protein
MISVVVVWVSIIGVRVPVSGRDITGITTTKTWIRTWIRTWRGIGGWLQ